MAGFFNAKEFVSVNTYTSGRPPTPSLSPRLYISGQRRRMTTLVAVIARSYFYDSESCQTGARSRGFAKSLGPLEREIDTLISRLLLKISLS